MAAPKNNSIKNLELVARSSEQLGQRVEQIRKTLDLTQAKLGQRAGLRQGTISKIESGVPTTELGTLFAICAELNLELVIRHRSKYPKKKAEDIFK